MSRIHVVTTVCAVAIGAGVTTAAAETIEFTAGEPSLDRWMYPFNQTPGQRGFASLFGAFGNPDFDNRDGQMLIGFNTADDIPTELGVDAYSVTDAVVTVQYDGQSDFVYDGTVDPVNVYLPEDDPLYQPDDDAGTPIELFGAGFRNGFTAETFEENSPHGDLFGWGVRNAYAMSFDDVGDAIDVSNNVRGFTDPDTDVGPLDPLVWAVGEADLETGDDVPTNTVFTFEINVEHPDIQQYFRQAMNEGRLRLMITSLHEVGVMTGSFPTIFTKENALVDIDAASAATLDLTVEINEDTEPADINGDGIVNVKDLLLLLGAWGACDECDEDITGDGLVNVNDLLELLGAWG